MLSNLATLFVAIVSGLIVAMWAHQGPISRVKWGVAAVLILGGLGLVWVIGLRSAGSGGETAVRAGGAAVTKTSPAVPKTETQIKPSGASQAASTAIPLGQKEPAHPPRQRLSQSLLLRDGDQQSILDGQATVGADFTQIGEMEVATLHFHGSGETDKDLAILNASDGFDTEVAGRRYHLSATKDLQARTVTVRIEEKR